MAAPTIAITLVRHEPQPVPARVRAITSRGVAQPPSVTAAAELAFADGVAVADLGVVGEVLGPSAAAAASRSRGSGTGLAPSAAPMGTRSIPATLSLADGTDPR